MHKRTVAVALSLTLAAAGGWALAQQGGPRSSAGGGPGAAGTGRAARPAAKAAPGRFSMVSSQEATLLLDTATGKTWVLSKASAGGPPFWLPVARADSAKDVNAILESYEEQRVILEVIRRELAARQKARTTAPKRSK
jgi:hypothetical protein